MYRFKESTDEPLVQVFDHTGQLRQIIRDALAAYKKRWNESLATKLVVINSIDELIPDIPVILAAYQSHLLPSTLHPHILVPSLNELTHKHLRSLVINPVVHYTKDLAEAKQWLNSLPDLFAFDTETAKADDVEPIPKVKLALDPYRNQFTMFSFASNETEAFVISNESQDMEDIVLNFLTSTNSTVIMHNSTFDMKLVKHRTGKFIKSIEDTQLMWRCINNHVDTSKALVGLKHLAKELYNDWAVSKDLFGIEHKYDSDLIHYSGIDAMATMYVYNEAINHPTFNYKRDQVQQLISDDLLPTPLPKDHKYDRFHFYSKVAIPLVRPTIDLMLEGLEVNFEAVDELTNTIDSLIEKIHTNIAANPAMTKFRQQQYKKAKSTYIEEQKAKQRSVDYYIKPLDLSKVDHRSYVMNYINIIEPLQYTPSTLLPDGTTKWTAKDVKHLLTIQSHAIVKQVADKSMNPNSTVALAAMRMLAITKANLYNKRYIDAIETVDESILSPFNPGSSKQLTALFNFYNIAPLAFSKDTGEPSWGRKQIEEVHYSTTDSDIKAFTSEFIDYSFAAIIKSTFIPAFHKFVTNGKLRGGYNLLGAKTARYTSDSPNMLNAPSSGSIYAKPFKRCIVAPPGFVVATADFAQLEDRVLACLTNDEGKCGILESKLDSHCYNCYGYYTEEVEAEIGTHGTMTDKVKRFMEIKESNPTLKSLRSKSKAPTFKLAYLGNPDADKGGAITQEIYDNYHNVLYSGVRDYIYDYVIPATKRDGDLHIALGWYIKSDNVDKDFRTLHNSTCQGWSILTAIAMAKVYQRIQEDGMQDLIQCTSTIYDSIYYNVKDDPKVIQWLNTELVKAMSVDFLPNQRIKNEASMEIGPSWAKLIELPNKASIEEIQQTLDRLKE